MRIETSCRFYDRPVRRVGTIQEAFAEVANDPVSETVLAESSFSNRDDIPF